MKIQVQSISGRKMRINSISCKQYLIGNSKFFKSKMNYHFKRRISYPYHEQFDDKSDPSIVEN